MIAFVVFKSPAEGRTHIFRPGEPMTADLIVPVTCDCALVPLEEEEAPEREMRGRRIHVSRPALAADSTWTRTPTRCSTASATSFASRRRRSARDEPPFPTDAGGCLVRLGARPQ
jgi:hypothetical protein